MSDTPSVSSIGEKSIPKTFLQKLQDRFIAPSPKIMEPDQRRQAALLSGFLIGIIMLASLAELVTLAFIKWENYTGYRQTILVVILLAIIYLISRTENVRLAAFLAVGVSSIAVFFAGWAEPAGVLGGLFDFLILPLWLGSMYLSVGWLWVLILADLIGLLVFPFLVSEVTFNDILVGPFSFIFVTSVLLLVLTRHRNRLEQDRRSELVEKEVYSRQSAARAEALLRVADRLNAQLDLDALLQVLSEEVSQALSTPLAIVMLYDKKQDTLYPTMGLGMPPELIRGILPLPGESYKRVVGNFGTVFALPDMQAHASLPFLNEFRRLDLHSIAFAAMEYGPELIGSLTAVTVGENREFTEDELLLLRGMADQAALAITNTRLYKDARRRLENLQALRAIDIAISSNHDLQKTLDVVLEQITQQLQVDAAAILLLNGSRQQLEFGASRGFQTSSLRFTSLKIGEGMAGQAAQLCQVVNVHDLRDDSQTLVNAPALSREGFVSYFAAPLITQGQVKGVLEVFHRSLLEPDEEWLGFLETLAGQAAIAIESTSLFDDLQRTNVELLEAYDSTIEGWSHALDLRDKETEGHTLRVTELTLELARALGIGEAELVHIRRGALLHDIGKMGVPDKILFKEGPLTVDEWGIMRKHPVYAHEMLRPIQHLRQALDIPYCHHEKWDGTGYPRGLKGEEIPLVARLFAVVDVWDALTSDRPYRPAWSPETVLLHIQAGAGQHFDPQVVEVFIELMRKKGMVNNPVSLPAQ